MPVLKPRDAALIANTAYGVTNQPDMKRVLMELRKKGTGLEDKFAVDDQSRFLGISGFHGFTQSTGFGFAAKGTNQYRDEVLIAIRGTQTRYDFITDGRFGLDRGPGGHLVHLGFNHTANSFIGELRDFLRNNNPSHIHFVGHSLGGALASLGASYLHQEKAAKISLYTFGAPRVGLAPFNLSTTRLLSADNIFRVYHDCDPVSMIPIFPYYHLPMPGEICCLKWPNGRISVEAHDRQHYLKSLGDAGWRAIKSKPVPVDWETRIERWLDSDGTAGDSMFSAARLWMITKALMWIIEEVAPKASIVLTANLTLLDHMAMLLYQGVLTSQRIAHYMRSLIRKTMEFLGRKMAEGVKLTVQFIRWVLDLLYAALRTMVQRALDNLQAA